MCSMLHNSEMYLERNYRTFIKVVSFMWNQGCNHGFEIEGARHTKPNY